MQMNEYNKSIALDSDWSDFSLNRLFNEKVTNLHVLDKDFIGLFTFNNFHTTILMDLLILFSIICAIYTILSKNPIISVLFLIGLYVSIASYLMIIGLQFIGLAYILIYVGAISILFIFILMLINVRISELLSNSINSVFLILIVTIILNSVLYSILPNKNIVDYILDYNDISSYKDYINDIFHIINVKWDNSILEYNTISTLGNTLYSDNFIFFMQASLILLLAMIGAIVITIKPSNN